MADPKYANLPGIAHDQPDVYETDDLPESDRYIQDLEAESDSVETLHVSAYEAAGRFKGRYIDSGDVDFSDRIRDSGRKGYVVFTDRRDDDSEETPVQRYRRLNCEVRELMEDLESTKNDQEDSSLTGLSLQVETLQKELSSLELERSLGSEKIRSLKDPSGEKLLSQLPLANKNDGQKKGTLSGPTTYEFYLKPELSKMRETMEVAQLEKRIEKLENLLDASGDKMSMLSVETNQKSITGAISVLSARTYLLEPAHLDHVEGRLFALQQKLREMSERKEAVEDVEKANKISELYDLVRKNESTASALPEIVRRLEALEDLHERALRFDKSLSQLDSVQEKLLSSLDNNKKLLRDTQSKITENVGAIQTNFSSLEKRLQALG